MSLFFFFYFFLFAFFCMFCYLVVLTVIGPPLGLATKQQINIRRRRRPSSHQFSLQFSLPSSLPPPPSPLSPTSSVLPLIITETGDLQDGSAYSVSMSYQDAAGNDARTDASTNVHFVGAATMAALINSPSDSDSIPQTWTLDVVFYERMSQCNLTIVHNSGPFDTGFRSEPVSSRILMFNPAALTAGSHIWTIGQISKVIEDQSNLFDWIDHPYDLVIGAIYDLALTCVDMAPESINPSATTTVSLVEFAGNRTLVPTFVAPPPFTSQRETFLVNFTLPESAKVGTVLLLLEPQVRGVGVNDPDGLRIITFSSQFEDGGQHTGTMQALSVAAGLGFIASIAPPLDLVDGTIYVSRIQYQDSVGNTQSGVNHTEIHYAGIDTIVPALTFPKSSSKIPQMFWLEFELFEKAFPGTVTLTFERTGGVLDTAGRVITFGTNFESAGVHVMQLDRMVFINQTRYPVELGSTGGVSPQVDLTDGTEYSVTLTYRDNAQNPASSKQNTFVTFDVTHPTMTSCLVNYSTGVMKVVFSEIIDMTLANHVVGGISRIDNVGLVDQVSVFLTLLILAMGYKFKVIPSNIFIFLNLTFFSMDSFFFSLFFLFTKHDRRNSIWSTRRVQQNFIISTRRTHSV